MGKLKNDEQYRREDDMEEPGIYINIELKEIDWYWVFLIVLIAFILLK